VNPAALLLAGVLQATPLPGDGPLAARPSEFLLLLGAAALLPVLLVTLTSFLKITVVLSILRSALGAPQVPPSSAVTGLALILTLAIMAPVAEAAWAAASSPPASELGAGAQTGAGAGAGAALEAGARALVPLKAFLARFAREDDREAFLDLGRRLRPAGRAGEVGGEDLAVLAPAFMVSELRRAFTIGFLVFLPFLVVDLVVANVLLALGLTQLSPASVALPLKLLLLVAVDGWRLLARGLALAYAEGGGSP
jgi:type III secretion protein R